MSEISLSPAVSTVSTWTRLRRTGVPLLVLRLIIGGLFIYTGVQKAAHPVAFHKMIREYNMVPEQPPVLLNSLAALLPWLEIWCGALLVLGVALRGAALIVLLMLSGFTVAIFLRAWGIHQAEQIPWCSIAFDCGCGTGTQLICAKIPENLALIAGSLLIVLSRVRRFCLRGDLFAARPHSG